MKIPPAEPVDAATHNAERLRSEAERIAGQRGQDIAESPGLLNAADLQRILHDLQVHQIELEMQNEELRLAQEALEASRARYFDLYELAPVGYFTLDEGGIIIEANLTGATLLGINRSHLLGSPFSRFMAEAEADTYYLHRKKLFNTCFAQHFDLRLIRGDGMPFNAWLETALVSGHEGPALCRVAMSDITELKLAQEELRQAQSLLQSAGEIARMGGWSIELPQQRLTWSDEVCVILDFPRGKVPTLAEALALYKPASRVIISAALDACASRGIAFDCELEILTAKRRPLTVRAIGQALRDESGRILGIDGAFQDISGQKILENARASLEAQLRESQKMEAIGTLAGGIAHDFNNILGTILGNVELARQDARANWQALVSLEEIRKAGHRARELVQQILSFSRRQPTSRRVIALAPIIEEAARLLRASLSGEVRIDCFCAADTPTVMADPTQVQQVLLNLGTNALHAMAGRSGRIEIRLEPACLDADSARFDLNLRPGRYAHVTVSDAGHGMDVATRGRIFEPFFTTKPVGEGTGLGLSVAQGIMQGHEGVILADSEPGKGSQFELYFPAAGGIVTSADSAELPGPSSEGRGQHILYIDDDEAQVFMIKRLLERWGYQVSAYIEQREALEALKAGLIPFSLVITDFKMPGLSGIDVARAVHEARPGLPVVVVSAYVNDALRMQAAAVGVSELIAKTHEVEDLRDLVQRLIPPPLALTLKHETH